MPRRQSLYAHARPLATVSPLTVPDATDRASLRLFVCIAKSLKNNELRRLHAVRTRPVYPPCPAAAHATVRPSHRQTASLSVETAVIFTPTPGRTRDAPAPYLRRPAMLQLPTRAPKRVGQSVWPGFSRANLKARPSRPLTGNMSSG